ncbi:MAG: hypothetical protein ACE5HD_11710 [Acidobacteriota bacterium]
MRSSKRVVWGLMAGLALALLIQGDSGIASEAGRNFSRCVQSCNDTNLTCGNACDATCTDLFPDRGASFTQCKSDCKDKCNADKIECKLVCQNIKNNPSPEEP